MEGPLLPHIGQDSIILEIFIDWIVNKSNADPLCCSMLFGRKS